ncbi:FeoA domain-containing protein [uncultured Nostoc sp.]
MFIIIIENGRGGIVTSCKTQDKTILKKCLSIGIVIGTHITLKQHFLF